LLMVSRLPAFALARISTVAVRTIAPWCLREDVDGGGAIGATGAP